MIDFSQIPMGYETPNETPDLEAFSKQFKQLENPPEFEHLCNITYRVTNGFNLSADLSYLETLEGYCEISETGYEDQFEEPVVAVFCDCGMNLDTIQPELFQFLMVELSRLRLIIRTDLHIATLAHCFWEQYHHSEADDSDPYASYPKWFLPLIEAQDSLHGQELRDWMWKQLDDKQTRMPAVTPTFKREKQSILEAIDRLAATEEPLINNSHDHTEYFSTEEGIFFLGRSDIDFHEDVMEALHTGLAESCYNPKRDLVGMARDDAKLSEIHQYLHAVDHLFEICKNLP